MWFLEERELDILETASTLCVDRTEVLRCLKEDYTHSEMRNWYVCMGHIVPGDFIETLHKKFHTWVKIL